MLKSGKRRREYPLEGKPLYFKTSGTTSGAKYIPLSKESMPYHIEASKCNLLYIHETGKADFVDDDFLEVLFWKKNTESSLVDYQVVAHFIPKYLQKIGCLLGKLIVSKIGKLK
jgi:hypothetical protein